MTTQNIVKRAVVSALGVLAYLAIFAWAVNHGQDWFGTSSQGWIGAALVLILFIVSACITGTLVLLKPILLYIDGQKKEALKLFAFTVASLAVIGIIIAGYLIIESRQAGMNSASLGQYCGGNMQNAPTCGSGYHCAPEPGSHLPFGDVGGICVTN